MLQLHVTDDRGAVTAFQADRFPLIIGRSPQAHLRVTAAGVFEEHARIDLINPENTTGQRFMIEPIGQSLLSVNGSVIPSKQLAIGDEISLGAARLLVSLAPARQSRLALHESLVWALLLFVVVLEAFVIHFAR
jgi:pSer/pThr/pTyr-binding forkhead associated (FHA) protein